MTAVVRCCSAGSRGLPQALFAALQAEAGSGLLCPPYAVASNPSSMAWKNPPAWKTHLSLTGPRLVLVCIVYTQGLRTRTHTHAHTPSRLAETSSWGRYRSSCPSQALQPPCRPPPTLANDLAEAAWAMKVEIGMGIGTRWPKRFN